MIYDDDACFNISEWVRFMDENDAFDVTREFVAKPVYYAILLTDGVMIFNCADYNLALEHLSKVEKSS